MTVMDDFYKEGNRLIKNLDLAVDDFKASQADDYDGDDPRCDQEYVARCRENWGGTWK